MTDTPDQSEWWPFDFFHYAAHGRLPEADEVPPNTRSVVTEPDSDQEVNPTMNISPAELRRHPVSALLASAADGADVDDDELDGLKLSAKARERVAEAAKATRRLKAEGENKAARDAAREAAASIVPALPEKQRDPRYLDPPPPDITDPRELADQVSDW